MSFLDPENRFESFLEKQNDEKDEVGGKGAVKDQFNIVDVMKRNFKGSGDGGPEKNGYSGVYILFVHIVRWWLLLINA